MTVNVTNEDIVIAAGATEQRNLPGAQLICYASTDEALVSMDNRGWLPFSRGIELNSPDGVFSNVYFKNPTATEIVLKVAVVSEPRVFVDRRELAAVVAVDGGIVTNTAPLTDQGGSISRSGSSAWGGTITAGTDIIAAVANLNGIYVRSARSQVLGGATASVSGVVGGNRYITLVNSIEVADKNTSDVFVPSGSSLRVAVATGATVYVRVSYDIL